MYPRWSKSSSRVRTSRFPRSPMKTIGKYTPSTLHSPTAQLASAEQQSHLLLEEHGYYTNRPPLGYTILQHLLGMQHLELRNLNHRSRQQDKAIFLHSSSIKCTTTLLHQPTTIRIPSTATSVSTVRESQAGFDDAMGIQYQEGRSNFRDDNPFLSPSRWYQCQGLSNVVDIINNESGFN